MTLPNPHRGVVGVFALVLVAGCTATPPTPPPETSPPASSPTVRVAAERPPATAFPPLPGRSATGASDALNDLATRGRSVVATGLAFAGGQARPTFFLSGDAGATWRQGELSGSARTRSVAGVGEYAHHLVAAPGGGWFALGESDDDLLLAWRSIDGRTWNREPVRPGQLRPVTDTVSDLVVTSAGLLAIGYRDPADGRSRPMAWSSPDGRRWVQRPLPGTGTAAAVAARGRVLVAVGEDAEGEDQRVWRSPDAGATWTRIRDIPRPPDDGDFSRSLSGVTATAGGFVATGERFGTTDEYAPTLYRSSDGRRWVHDPSARELSTSTSGSGSSIHASGAAVLAVTEENRRYDVPQLFAALGRGWRLATTPLAAETNRSGPAFWDVPAAVATDSGWVVVARRQDNGILTSQVWRSTDGGASFHPARVPRARENVAWALPGDLTLAEGRPLVTGRSQGLSVRWRQGTSGRFGPPEAVSGSTADRVDGAAVSGSELLAYGSRLGGALSEGTVWIGGLTGPVTRSRRFTFHDDNRYAWSEINQARRVGGRWYVVGQKSTNGSLNRSALVYSSADGRRWTEGQPERTLVKEGGDVWYDITDLDGDHDTTREMEDVAGVPGGLVAVGATSEDAIGTNQPALWRSADGQRWRLDALPVRGFHAGRAWSVVAQGRRVVAVGQVRSRGADQGKPYRWTSTDGGRTWRGQTLPARGEEPVVSRVIRTRSAFVAYGVTGDRPERPQAWVSSDGTTWSPLALAVPRVGPEEALDVPSLTAAGPDLVGIATVTNRAGAGAVLFRQRVR